MISIIGLKNAGKTTFLVALAAELVRRKFRVMTIKHGSHPADMDQKGKDTWRHWHEGNAERVLMESPGQRVLFERAETESDPITLTRRYLGDADIVLVEPSSSRTARRSPPCGGPCVMRSTPCWPKTSQARSIYPRGITPRWMGMRCGVPILRKPRPSSR